MHDTNFWWSSFGCKRVRNYNQFYLVFGVWVRINHCSCSTTEGWQISLLWGKFSLIRFDRNHDRFLLFSSYHSTRLVSSDKFLLIIRFSSFLISIDTISSVRAYSQCPNQHVFNSKIITSDLDSICRLDVFW